MNIEEFKKLTLPKINVGNITKNVKKIIKSEKYKEQNFREGIHRKNLTDLRDLISDVSTNRNKYGFRDDIINNLEMLNYNILRLLNKSNIPQPQPNIPQPQPNIPQPINYDIDDDDDDDGFPPPPNIGIPPPPPPPPNIPPPPPNIGIPPPPPPPPNIPPPPPPPPINDGFPPLPPSNLFDNDNQDENINPTLPPPLPPFPSLEPLTAIVKSARENLLDEIKKSKKLKTKEEQKPLAEPEPKKKEDITLLDEIMNPPIVLKTKEEQKPLAEPEPKKKEDITLLDEIMNPPIVLKTKAEQKELEEPKKFLSANEDFMLNTFNKFIETRRKQLQQSSDEDEDEDTDVDDWI